MKAWVHVYERRDEHHNFPNLEALIKSVQQELSNKLLIYNVNRISGSVHFINGANKEMVEGYPYVQSIVAVCEVPYGQN